VRERLLEPLSPKKLGSGEVTARIRTEITRGNLANNTRLPAERELAAAYNVSRGTIRQALNRLSKDGLVSIKPGSGAYVTYGADNEDAHSVVRQTGPLELVDARFALEPHICRLAVLHGHHSDFDKLEALIVDMEKNEANPASFSDADTMFHRLLATCTGNSFLVWVIGQITTVRNQDEWTRMRRLTLNPAITKRYNQQHRKILEAIRAREPELAATRMREHLETARLSLTRAADT
jgi:DNA-binding FadR family transcriptional regulator